MVSSGFYTHIISTSRPLKSWNFLTSTGTPIILTLFQCTHLRIKAGKISLFDKNRSFPSLFQFIYQPTDERIVGERVIWGSRPRPRSHVTYEKNLRVVCTAVFIGKLLLHLRASWWRTSNLRLSCGGIWEGWVCPVVIGIGKAHPAWVREIWDSRKYVASS